MPWFRFGDMMAHVKMTDTRKRPAPLQCRAPRVWPGGRQGICVAMSTRLCDWPVGDGTCDMPICEEHATGGGVDIDFCPKHAAQRQGAAP